MALAFYGIQPGNPGGACPAVFRDPSTGDFLMQGKKTATSTIVRLPASMIDIIKGACRDDALARQPAPAVAPYRASAQRDDDGDFLMEGEPVTAPQTLAQIAAESPILDDEAVVRLPASMAAELLEVCSDHLVR